MFFYGQDYNNVKSLFLTHDAQCSTDADDRAGVDLADVHPGVRLLDVVQLEVVGLAVVVGDADPVVLRNHVGVDGQGPFDGVEPSHLVVPEVAHCTREVDLVTHTDGVVHELGVAEPGRVA